MANKDSKSNARLKLEFSEIEREEKDLKRRKILLQKQYKWYKNPTNIIGIVTIIVMVSIAIFTLLINSKYLELTCKYSEPKPLTSFSPEIQENISIKYKNSEVMNIGKINVTLENTGTAGITMDDFVDGPIEFYVKNKSSEFYEKSQQIPPMSDWPYAIPFLLDIAVIENANQRNDSLYIYSYSHNAKFTYLPSLINKGEIIEFELYISDINEVSIEILGNLKNGNLIVKKYFSEEEEVGKFISLSNSIIGLFGSKVMAMLAILLIIFIVLINYAAIFSHSVTIEPRSFAQVISLIPGIVFLMILIVLLIV